MKMSIMHVSFNSGGEGTILNKGHGPMQTIQSCLTFLDACSTIVNQLFVRNCIPVATSKACSLVILAVSYISTLTSETPSTDANPLGSVGLGTKI